MFADDSTAYFIGNLVNEVTPGPLEIINDMNAWSRSTTLTNTPRKDKTDGNDKIWIYWPIAKCDNGWLYH